MIARLTESLAARLTAATYTAAHPSVAAQKAYLPYHDNEAMTSLRVSVIPREVEITKTGRGSEQHDYLIAVVIAKRTDGSVEQVDALLGLVEKMSDLLRSNAMPQVQSHPWPDGVSWWSTTLDPVWSQEHLEERRVFFTAIVVGYRAILPHDGQQP